jgi:hypothetical protein
VTDFGPGRPEPRRVRLDEAGGRGLLFVENLATDWGWTSDDSSKSVWFRIEIDALQAA